MQNNGNGIKEKKRQRIKWKRGEKIPTHTHRIKLKKNFDEMEHG